MIVPVAHSRENEPMKLGFAFVSLLFLSSNAFADTYAAIAYDPSSGNTNISEGTQSVEASERAALRSCGTNCLIAVSARDAYVAFARGNNQKTNGWGGGWGRDAILKVAKGQAMLACQQRAQNCKIEVIGGVSPSSGFGIDLGKPKLNPNQ